MAKKIQTLKEWRQERGLTLEELGGKVNMSKSSYRDYETARIMPGIDLAYRIVEALGIDLSQVSDWLPEQQKAEKI